MILLGIHLLKHMKFFLPTILVLPLPPTSNSPARRVRLSILSTQHFQAIIRLIFPEVERLSESPLD